MSAKGTKWRTEMTPEKIKQRQQAAVRHGVYAKNITPERAAAIAEMSDRLSTRPGVMDAMIEQAAKAVKVADLALGYVAQQHQAGKPLDNIAMARALPAFLNSAARSLAQLYAMLPDENKTIDITEMLQGGRDDGPDSDG